MLDLVEISNNKKIRVELIIKKNLDTDEFLEKLNEKGCLVVYTKEGWENLSIRSIKNDKMLKTLVRTKNND